jgi:hypothetical protein
MIWWILMLKDAVRSQKASLQVQSRKTLYIKAFCFLTLFSSCQQQSAGIFMRYLLATYGRGSIWATHETSFRTQHSMNSHEGRLSNCQLTSFGHRETPCSGQQHARLFLSPVLQMVNDEQRNAGKPWQTVSLLSAGAPLTYFSPYDYTVRWSKAPGPSSHRCSWHFLWIRADFFQERRRGCILGGRLQDLWRNRYRLKLLLTHLCVESHEIVCHRLARNSICGLLRLNVWWILIHGSSLLPDDFVNNYCSQSTPESLIRMAKRSAEKICLHFKSLETLFPAQHDEEEQLQNCRSYIKFLSWIPPADAQISKISAMLRRAAWDEKRGTQDPVLTRHGCQNARPE